MNLWADASQLQPVPVAKALPKLLVDDF